ncbi:hypothetical protein F9L33_07675 [Amylibacter sp. SFDW26]|uniref:hypothetical protein n=1 Tax=Amylibacter sp. SFDW26 TaxID=2652722 RepID=UPI0012624BB4|nr:hypothetical protein [Amylibacter sp. SFDW26]KAB7614511.1 hypothetical protein F9L33_07675 [Amylibacter sp. SFDW26]
MAITLEQAIEATKLKELSELDISVFSDEDAINFILQRSEVLSDIEFSGRIVRAWTNGNETPIRKTVSSMKEEVIKRAIGFIYLEYLKLKPLLLSLKNKKVCDIGCGYAIFDFFVAKELGSKVVLIDLENNDKRHFGYKNEGAAYTNLSVAKKFLVQNGIKANSIKTVNPNTDSLEAIKDVDIAVSFISCGFHYPWTEYEDFFKTSVSQEGSIILDVRNRLSDRIQNELSALGDVSVLHKTANDGADRIYVQKT